MQLIATHKFKIDGETGYLYEGGIIRFGNFTCDVGCLVPEARAQMEATLRPIKVESK